MSKGNILDQDELSDFTVTELDVKSVNTRPAEKEVSDKKMLIEDDQTIKSDEERQKHIFPQIQKKAKATPRELHIGSSR